MQSRSVGPDSNVAAEMDGDMRGIKRTWPFRGCLFAAPA